MGVFVTHSDDEEPEVIPDIDFEYGDEDSMAAELAELYSYSEGTDLQVICRHLQHIYFFSWFFPPLGVAVTPDGILVQSNEAFHWRTPKKPGIPG